MVPAAFAMTLAAALAVGLAVGGEEAAAPTGTDGSTPPAVEVEATSIYRFATLDEMVAASDLVVVGTVVATEPGRLVGDPDDGGVISRLVTIAVDEVVTGADQLGGATVLVEEEGTLPDGTPLIVNGVAGSEVDDHGIWFLDRLDDAEVPAYLVINSQGRFLTPRDQPDGEVIGGDRRDLLVRSLEQQTLADLVVATRAAAARADAGAG